MRLKKIIAQNYRCFDYSEFQFGLDSTIFIGKNGTGKSSILSSIRKGLSFLFSDNKDEINPLKANNSVSVSPILLFDTRFDELREGFIWPTSLKYSIEFYNEDLNWEFYKKSHPGGLHSTLYRETKSKIINELIALPEKWPLFAFYGDSYPHSFMNLGNKASKIIKSITLPRDFAYYGWESHLNCNILWEERFKYIDNYDFSMRSKIRSFEKRLKNLEEKAAQINLTSEEKDLLNKDFIDHNNFLNTFSKTIESEINIFQKEKEFIEHKFQLFTQPLDNDYNFINQDFEVVSISALKLLKNDFTLKFLMRSGKMMSSEMLPMGYKRLFYILFDLSYREFILTKGEYQSHGIAIIDEIELHLHPTLQQEVLHRFKKTFPNIQFIVTTHSPLVISNFKADEKNKIIKLENFANEYTNKEVENVYGLDYSSNLSEIMEVSPRSSTIDKYINAYLFLYKKNKLEDADKMLTKLKEYIGGTIPTHLQQEIDNQKKSIL